MRYIHFLYIYVEFKGWVLKLWLNLSIAGVVIFEHLYWPQLIFKWQKAVVLHLGSLSAIFPLFTLRKQVPHLFKIVVYLLTKGWDHFYCLSERERLNNRSEMTVLRSRASFFMQENSHWNAWRCPWFWWAPTAPWNWAALVSETQKSEVVVAFCHWRSPPALAGFLWTPADCIVRLPVFKQMSVW